MKKPGNITSVLSKISFPESSLENYFSNKHKTAVADLMQPDAISGPFARHFEIIGFGSAHVPVSGTVEISFSTGRENEIISMDIPVTTSFLMTCTKGKEPIYKVTWSCSLS